MDMFKPNRVASVSFEGSTLLLPIVSLANLPQLTADLLIHTFDLALVGSLSAKDHIPVVGASESAENEGFLTPVEVYQSKDGKVTLIHQRSPPLKARKDDFITKLVSFIQSAQFKQILLLSSMDASTRQDSDLQQSDLPFRYLSTSKSSLNEYLSSKIPQHKTSSSTPVFSAGGITRRFLDAARDKIQLDTLLMYVVEGDNRGDARALAGVVAEAVFGKDASAVQWKEPKSWDLALYGKTDIGEMFG